jgi:hypothetical protein
MKVAISEPQTQQTVKNAMISTLNSLLGLELYSAQKDATITPAVALQSH